MKYTLLISLLALASPIYAQTPAQLAAEITSLKSTVTALQAAVAALQSKSTSTQATDASQSTSLATLQRQVTLIAQNPALGLGPFVSITTAMVNGVTPPTVVFSNCNLQLTNGSGRTDLRNGRGNLLIGYCESPTTAPDGQSVNFNPQDRGGSHCVVVGKWHEFTGNCFASLVAGEENIINGEGQVCFGSHNGLGAVDSSVLGGAGNVCSGGPYSVIVGGDANNAGGGTQCVILGGADNSATGDYVTVTGGINVTGTSP